MIVYKINVTRELSKKGYTDYRIKKDKIIGGSTITHLRNREPISFETLNTVCKLLECQPGDIIEYVPDVDWSNYD